MNPIQQLRDSRDLAYKAYQSYNDLYNALCAAHDRINLHDPGCRLRWSLGELQLTEDGKAIVRWKYDGQTVILISVVANDPARRAWGHGYHDKEPYYDERMQERPPQAWLDFVGAYFTE